MYIVISPKEIITIETKTDLSTYINLHRNTITNKFNTSKQWEHKEFKVIQADRHLKRNRKGNKDSFAVKKQKSLGIIK